MSSYNQMDNSSPMQEDMLPDQLSVLEEDEGDEENGIKRDQDDAASSVTGSSEDKTKQKEEDQEFVRKESRYVFALRIVVVVILVLAATAVCVVIYHETTSSEYQEFHAAFDASGEKVTDTFMEIAQDNMGAAGSLVVAIVAHGIALENKWPFVALSSFQQRAATVMRLSGALYIGVNPLVTHDNRKAWENYSRNSNAASWYQEGRKYQVDLGFDELDNRPQVQTEDPELDLIGGIANHIYSFHRSSEARAVISPLKDLYLPVWQTSPVTGRSMVNQDRASNSEAAMNCLYDDEIVFEGMQHAEPGFGSDSNPFTAEFAWLLRMNNRERTPYEGDIFTTVYLPLYDNFSVNRTTVGVMRIVIQWARYFRNILPENSKGVVFVLENNCDEPFTYQIDGGVVTPLGHGDLHDTNFDYMKKTASFKEVVSISDGTERGLKMRQDECPYEISVYPSRDFLENHTTNTPAVITVSVGFVFLFAIIMFFVYDRLVEKRQRKIMSKAQKTHAIVAELFPEKVRNQLLDFDEKNISGNYRLKSFLHDNHRGGGMNVKDSTVIADLFPHASVLFADISGFTAWSSSREPAQVFVLLQNIYKAFDDIARKYKVFKVETIGDSYVAVTGIPDPQPKHALIITMFAAECLSVLKEITQNLESTLGPDTGDLSMRFGIHSGPVTAGVLRGERSRFQLFGDVVNTASRIETTGIPGRIHISESTCELLKAAGKEQWIKPRTDQVLAKGKGVLKTYWVTPSVHYGSALGSAVSGSVVSGNSANGEDDNEDANSVGNAHNQIVDTVENEFCLIDERTDALLKHQRMVDWVVQLLRTQIEKIVYKHHQQEQDKHVAAVSHKKGTKRSHGHSEKKDGHRNRHNALFTERRRKGQTALDEVVEAITFPKFDFKTKPDAPKIDSESVEISEEITTLLRKYVAIVANAHGENPFHNFERTCHVLMSVSKFLNRMAMFDLDSEGLDKTKDVKKLNPHLHDYTRLIVSDPVTVLASLMAALVHNVDHRGVSNTQLVKEEPQLAQFYKDKCVAEQNSLEVSWTLFMASQFKPLREYIFSSSEDLSRFRQVLVNCVIATDIFDEELVSERNIRYEKAFSPEVIASSNSTAWGKDAHKDTETNALRATIALENIIQASDVFYALQHWRVYQRWNESKFNEAMKAYQSGRVHNDPANDWYQNELHFFDKYIIPVAQKLKDSSVFGVCSDECLSYAQRNRVEWMERGEQLVRDMLARREDEDYGEIGMESDSSNPSLVGVTKVEMENISSRTEKSRKTEAHGMIKGRHLAKIVGQQKHQDHRGDVDAQTVSTCATNELSGISDLHQ